MVKEETIEDIINLLSGQWFYNCKLDAGYIFDNGDIERGGTMQVKVSLGHFGFNIDILATRDWGVDTSNTKTCYSETEWNAKGGIYEDESSVYFTYKGLKANSKIKGKTRDIFLVDLENKKLSRGKFEHVKEDGSLIYGSVELFKGGNLS